MNLILLSDQDFVSDRRARLFGRRAQHIHAVLRSQLGDTLTVGRRNGNVGRGTVMEMGDEVILDVILDTPPPNPLPMSLVVALPRPHLLKRVLFFATCLGIKQIVVLQFARVEKSFWNSSSLRPEAIEEQLVLGLEQAKDTRMPTVTIRDRFKPFVEDELSVRTRGTTAIVAHPGGKGGPDHDRTGSSLILVLGPEGGIVPFELDCLVKAGCIPLDFGPRILRVDTALAFAVGRLLGQ